MAPAVLQRLIKKVIDDVLDAKAFNAEIEAEKRDAAHLETIRRIVQKQLQEDDFKERPF